MVEAPIPTERSLVPRVLVTERPYLNHDQTQTVGKLTIDYLRRNKVAFTQEAIRVAFEVLAFDALPRGLALEGKQHLGESDNVRKFIAKGLENRKGIREKAQAALHVEGNAELLGSRGEFVGIYAFDRNLIARVNRRIEHFPVLTDISDYDELALQYELRKAALGLIAEAVIRTLPKEKFPLASLDKIPDLKDQAKLVRNSLVSLIFKGLPSPILSIEELRIILANPVVSEKQKRDSIESLIRILPDDNFTRSQPLKDYILSLTNQALSFLVHPRLMELRNESDLINIRDSIYGLLSHTLLLLHPALEEKQLITDPEESDIDSYSLWSPNFSVVMDGLRFPTQQGLLRAIRFYKARGYVATRYTEALGEWRSFFTSKEKEQSKIPNLIESIGEIDRTINSVLLGEYELPPYAYDLMRTYHRDIHDRVMFIRSRRSGYEETIKSAIDYPQEAEEYYQKILEENQGNIPDKMRAPESMKERTKRTLKSLYSHYRELAAKILEENLPADEALHRKGLNSWDKLTDEELNEEIASVKTLISQIEAGGRIPNEFPSVDELSRIIENRVRLLERRTERGYKGTRLPGDQERLAELKPIYSQVMGWRFSSASERKKRAPKIRRNFYLYELKSQLNGLTIINDARKEKKELTEDPESEIYYWTKEEMLRWRQMSKASNFPIDAYEVPDLNRFADEAYKWQTEYSALDGYYKRKFLPNVITSVFDFGEHLGFLMASLQARQNARVPKNEVALGHFIKRKNYLKQQIACLVKLIYYQENPLFPFSDSLGLSSNDFITAAFNRFRLARVIVALSEEDKEDIELEKNYVTLVRDNYLDHLRSKKSRIQAEIESITNDPDSKNRLIQRMRSLNLVVPEKE